MSIRKLLSIAAITMAAQAAMAGYADVSAPLSERVERLEQMMGSQSSGNLNETISQLQQELAMVRGELEMANHEIEKLNLRQRELYSDLDGRISQLRQQGTAKSSPRG